MILVTIGGRVKTANIVNSVRFENFSNLITATLSCYHRIESNDENGNDIEYPFTANYVLYITLKDGNDIEEYSKILFSHTISLLRDGMNTLDTIKESLKQFMCVESVEFADDCK